MGRTPTISTSAVSAQAQQDAVSEGIENFQLPRSLITKLARSGMSEDAKMQKDVVLSYQKSATVFINYLAATAHEVAASKQHKSISASDVLKALEMVDMGDMVQMIQQELDVYRDIQKADKNRKSSSASKGKARESQAESASVSTSISARSSGKNKERAQVPSITISRAQSATRPESAPQSEPEAEPDDEEGDEEHALEEDEEMLEPEDGAEEDVEEEDEEDEGEGDEQPGDPITVEDEELRRDARGLEDGDDA
ncbi:hypothetical protein IEO21_03107 [Rhodonia placenta]|uniref:DNA polymerase epsilon subunit D n=1 Tax=Rhodonia placenta TaxID=104341 RepID=A0A8H7P6A5_9APHY|nr:hypothetical protein IEO21_03107 [Postia placenta]